MHFTIRAAAKKDCPAMMDLVRELALFERAPQEVTVSMQHFEESGFGPNPVWWALVAETNDGQIAGMALYYIRYSTWKGQRMYLEDIVVRESMRGNGIGKKLMDALIAEAKQKGFSRMVWQVLDWNDPAIEFYKKLGAKLDEEWINCSLDFE